MENDGRPNTGYLLFRVYSAQEALPISGARILLRESDNGAAYERTLLTNRSGTTETLALESKSKELSLHPGRPAGYTEFEAEITAEGYYPQTVPSIRIFPSVVSVQSIALIPLAANKPNDYIPKN